MTWLRRILSWLAKLLEDRPVPVPEPPPEEPPAAQDAIAPQFVTWDDGGGEDVGAWPVTVQLSDVQVKGGRIYWQQTGAVWPSLQLRGWRKPAIGNIWVLGKVRGRWHAATWDWIGPGARIKQLPRFEDVNDIHGPLEGWFPIPGDEVGFMLSTFARSGVLDTRQRSQIVLVRMP